MTPAQLGQKLRAGETVVGTLITSPSPSVPRALEGVGLDFVFLDTEHIALDRTQLSWMCQTYSRMGLPPIVRIPSPDPYAACIALDGGASGVVAPYLESAAQVQTLRGAVKLRPIKGERLGQRLAGESFEPVLESYVKGRNSALMIANIESGPAMAALDEILAAPGLDAVLIGPHDLSCSLGMPEEYDRPEFLAACEKIFRQARAAGVGAGIHFSSTSADLTRFHALGANFLIHSSDIVLFQRLLRSDIQEIRQATGGAKTAGSAETIIV